MPLHKCPVPLDIWADINLCLNTGCPAKCRQNPHSNGHFPYAGHDIRSSIILIFHFRCLSFETNNFALHYLYCVSFDFVADYLAKKLDV